MKIALIGASGNVGSRIKLEALARGHCVTGIVRHPEKLPAQPGLAAVAGDITDGVGLSGLLAGHDVVISAVKFTHMHLPTLLAALKKTGVRRLLMVGGAGSLRTPEGGRFVDAPAFPSVAKAEALAGCAILDQLGAEADLEWSFLSPSILFLPGLRTGQYRLGKDDLLFGADGRSSISLEDYAVAMLDEAETPRHVRQRFTVGY